MRELPRFDIDPDITRAWTPPGWVYTDPGVFARQRESVFAKSWQLVGDAGRLTSPGSVEPCMFLAGLLPEPLVLARDEKDGIACFSNVCTHRANLVVDAPGVLQVLRCRYHGRRFGLDGRFRSMPEFEGVANFPSPADDLPKVALGRWSRFLFAALDPATPFEAWSAPLRERIGGAHADAAQFAPERSREYEVRTNWAVYVENYLEGFHIPYVHAGLNEAVDYGSYEVHTLPHVVVQVARERGSDAPGAHYAYLWPNTMFNVYPWGFSVNVVRPEAVDRTRVAFLTWVTDPGRLETGAGAGLHAVELEDEAIVEAVMSGLGSRLYRRGRYSPRREPGVHHFHRLLAAAVGPTPEG
jgi:choline monooxygenase